MEDYAIILQAKIYKVNKKINQLKEIGLNVKKHEIVLSKIKEELGKDLTYDDVNKIESPFFQHTYIVAITGLDKLYNNLKEYDIYFKADNFIKILTDFINDPKGKAEELSSFHQELIGILNKLKHSETLDYEVEGPIIEDIYRVAYEFIKTELKLTGESPTLEVLKTNEVDSYYLDKFIMDSINKISSDDFRFNLVQNKKRQLDQVDDGNYLDLDFISLLIFCDINPKEFTKKISTLKNMVETYKARHSEIHNNIENLKKEKETSNRRIAAFQKSILKNLSLTITSLTLAATLAVSAFCISRKISKTKYYENKITSYDTLGNEDTTTEKSTDVINEIKLYAYEPYEKQRSDFLRQVAIYDLTSLGDLTLNEYLALNFADLGIDPDEVNERKDSLSLSDLYETTYYKLEKITTNPDEFTLKSESEYFVFWLIVSLIIGFVIDFLLEVFLAKINFNEEGEWWGFIDGIISIKQELENINKEKTSLAQNNSKIEELEYQFRQLFIDYKPYFEEIKQILPYLENNPKFTTKFNEFNEDLKLIRQL